MSEISAKTLGERAVFRQLDLGSGRVERAQNAIRADLERRLAPDIVLDATSALPFRSNALKHIFCFDILEHIADIPALMTEMHRVLEPNGKVTITTPHYSCANSYSDPTHVHQFGWRSFDCFTGEQGLAYYPNALFEIAQRTIRFHGGPIDSVIRRLASRWPDLYEHRLAWVFPAWYMEFELTAVK